MFKKIVFLFLISCVINQIKCSQRDLSHAVVLRAPPKDKKFQNTSLFAAGAFSSSVLVSKVLDKSFKVNNIFNAFIVAMAIVALVRNVKNIECASHDRCIKNHLNPRIFIAVFCLINLLINRNRFKSDSSYDLDFYSSCAGFGLMALSGLMDKVSTCQPESNDNSPV